MLVDASDWCVAKTWWMLLFTVALLQISAKLMENRKTKSGSN